MDRSALFGLHPLARTYKISNKRFYSDNSSFYVTDLYAIVFIFVIQIKIKYFKMVDKDPELNALEPGELDIFVDSMEPSKIDRIGNQA